MKPHELNGTEIRGWHCPLSLCGSWTVAECLQSGSQTCLHVGITWKILKYTNASEVAIELA